MFLRLRDVAHLDRCVVSPAFKFYIDPYNLNTYCSLYIDALPEHIKNRLIYIPPIYRPNLLDIVRKFVEKEKDSYPELVTILNNTKKEDLICEVLHYVDHYRYWDIWTAFAEKYIIRNLIDWCKGNNIPYGM